MVGRGHGHGMRVAMAWRRRREHAFRPWGDPLSALRSESDLDTTVVVLHQKGHLLLLFDFGSRV